MDPLGKNLLVVMVVVVQSHSDFIQIKISILPSSNIVIPFSPFLHRSNHGQNWDSGSIPEPPSGIIYNNLVSFETDSLPAARRQTTIGCRSNSLKRKIPILIPVSRDDRCKARQTVLGHSHTLKNSNIKENDVVWLHLAKGGYWYPDKSLSRLIQ